jgi:hypothetical protein
MVVHLHHSLDMVSMSYSANFNPILRFAVSVEDTSCVWIWGVALWAVDAGLGILRRTVSPLMVLHTSVSCRAARAANMGRMCCCAQIHHLGRMCCCAQIHHLLLVIMNRRN